MNRNRLRAVLISSARAAPWRLITAGVAAACLAAAWLVWRDSAMPAAPPAADALLTATVQRLVAQLRSEESETDDAAAAALAALGPPAVPALAALLRDPSASEDVKARAIETLARMRAAAAIGPLAGTLAEQSVQLRIEAVQALGAIADRQAVPALIAQYRHDEAPQVRYECLTSLGLIGDPGSADLLLAETSSADLYARMWALDALCQMGAATAADAALRLLEDPSVYVRRRALRSCTAALTSPAAEEAVIRHAVHDPDFETSVWARRVMEQRLADPADHQRLAAPIQQATAALVDTRPALTQEQYQAIFLLAELGDGAATDSLIAALHAPDMLVRHHAAFLLGRGGDVRAIPALTAALDDDQGLVRGTAREALRQFAERGEVSARDAIAQPRP